MYKTNLNTLIFLLLTFNVFADTLPLDVKPNVIASEPTADMVTETAESIPVVTQGGIPTENSSGSSSTSLREQAPIESAVFVHKVKGKMNSVYKSLFTKLENNGYYVIFEPNIGRNLAHSEKRWGKDYNKNKLESIRSMVFCNGWYANKISNEDPTMLALCPLHVTLIHKKDFTSILFVKPGQVSKGSSANSIALEIEQDVIRIIKESTP